MPSAANPVHSLYVLKAAGAFAVVMLHTSFILKTPLLPLLRLAVPLFLLITGYFLWSADRTQMLRRIRRTALKMLKITLVANVVYAGFLLLRGDRIPFSLPDALRLLLYGDNFCGQLWYMNAAIEALLVIWLFVRSGGERWLARLTPVLFLLCLALGKYAWVWGLDALPEMSRNGLLTGLPFIWCGCMLRQRAERTGGISPSRLGNRVFWLAVALCGCYAEYALLHLGGLIRTGDVLFFTIPAALLLFSICLQCRDFGRGTLVEKIGMRYSTNIYLYHHLCSLALLWLLGSGVFRTVWYRTAGSAIVFLLTLAVAALLRHLRMRLREVALRRS